MSVNNSPKNQAQFDMVRVGCQHIKQVVDTKKEIVYNYCQLLANYKCKVTSCYLLNCPIVQERIHPGWLKD